MTKEASIEEDLRLVVEASGGRCIKLPSAWYRGIPDRLVILPGARIFFIELKRDKPLSRTSIHQKRWREFLLGLGFNSYIIHGKSHLKEFLDAHVLP